MPGMKFQLRCFSRKKLNFYGFAFLLNLLLQNVEIPALLPHLLLPCPVYACLSCTLSPPQSYFVG